MDSVKSRNDISMKIPIFEEIFLIGKDFEALKVAIPESRIGEVPCYLNLVSQNKEDIERLILNLEQIFLENNFHPLFPYPLYIVSTIPVKSLFPWVRTVKDLPEHYFKKIKRPNNKEIQLLNKLYLKVSKIKNLELYKINGDFKESALNERKLYNETKELYFLETINSHLFGKPKK